MREDLQIEISHMLPSSIPTYPIDIYIIYMAKTPISPLSKSHIQPDDGPIYGPKHVVVYLTMH
jgi:hypothetical protein